MPIDPFDRDFTRTTIVNAIRDNIDDGAWPFQIEGDSSYDCVDSRSNRSAEIVGRLLDIDTSLRGAIFPEGIDYESSAGWDLARSAIEGLTARFDEPRLVKLANDLMKTVDKADGRSSRNLSARLTALRQLIEYETDTIQRSRITLSDNVKGERSNAGPERRGQVFLSYQFKDWLYTIGLFLMFRDCGMFLFVDWMHNGKGKDGRSIKSTLLPEIAGSEKFVLFPHYKLPYGKSEDSSAVTAWCAWEIGVRYEMTTGGSGSKYLLDPSKGAQSYPILLDSMEKAYKMGDLGE